MEVFYINKAKGKFNKLNKQNDSLTIVIEDNQEWKLYKEIRPTKLIKYESTGFIWKSIAFIYALFMVMKLMGLI